MPRADKITSITAPSLALALIAGCADPPVAPPAPGGACNPTVIEVPVPPIHTPRWAFEPWISKDISTGDDTRAFVQGFKDRGIPVGAVVLDSPWETNYNTFTPNPSRYPDFIKMVSDLHAEGVKVVLWTTQFVNSTSFDLENGGDTYEGAAPKQKEGLECGFFVNEGAEYGWWKGVGASVDFFNPKAAAWWHAQQDQVLDAGIDGWKLDFGESYIGEATVRTAAGEVSLQEYSEAYYKDFLSYGVLKRGKDFLTMVRAYDESYSFEGRFFARPEHAPVAWMGDNRRDWIGLADALDHMFRSANAGYAVLGSDIGGYLDRDDKMLAGSSIPLDPVVFARWTGVAALTPFMQLHGRANIDPWSVPQQNDEIVNLYRYWSVLHSQLVPFFYSLAEAAYVGAKMPVRPVADEAAWAGDYRYMLGDALLVAPVLDASGERDVALPAGGPWYDWWAPEAAPLPGGQTLSSYDATDIARIPLFLRAGAIVPMAVDGGLTVLIYPPNDQAASEFNVFDEDGELTRITSTAGLSPGVSIISMSRVIRDTKLRVRAESSVAGVKLDGSSLPLRGSLAELDTQSNGWFLDMQNHALWIKTQPLPVKEHVFEVTWAP